MSIRIDIISASPIFHRHTDKVSEFETDPDALGSAVESHLRGIPSMSAIDGVSTFHVMEETATELQAVGLAHFLPSSLIPLAAVFRMANGKIAYRVQLGAEDEIWEGLTQKKRWSAVYLYATENQKPKWNWEPPLEGFLNQ